MDIKEDIKNICKNVMFDEPMKAHTTFRVGGCADIFCEPSDTEELQRLIVFLKEKNIDPFIMGNGSNLLVGDKGIRGVVIKIGPEMSNIEVKDEKIHAGAGCLLSRISSVALNNELTGFECLGGIPGSLGGAAFMNAGAYGGEFADVVEEVKCVTFDGEIKTFKKEDLGYGYRKSIFTGGEYIIVSCILELSKGIKSEIEEKMKDYAKRRSDKQPLNFPSAGSTFKRPEGHFAGKLIEDCNLKGYRIGGAAISEKHAGFIINYDNATAADILLLIDYVRETVYKKYSLVLEPEVRIVGKF